MTLGAGYPHSQASMGMWLRAGRIAVYVLLFPLVKQMAELSPYSCSVSVTQCVDVLSR